MGSECRCGTHVELPHATIQLFSHHGDVVLPLCEQCCDQAVRFVCNEAADVTRSSRVAALWLAPTDPEDQEWDDLSRPVEEWIDLDLMRGLRRDA